MRPNLVYLEAENGKKGLDFAQRHHPDLIFLDIHLPDMDGFTVLSHLSNTPETSDIPVIALTGNASAIDIPAGLAAGFKEILSKPINLKAFFNVLDTILGT
jgi:CheY-like chemotaxis protein